MLNFCKNIKKILFCSAASFMVNSLCHGSVDLKETYNKTIRYKDWRGTEIEMDAKLLVEFYSQGHPKNEQSKDFTFYAYAGAFLNEFNNELKRVRNCGGTKIIVTLDYGPAYDGFICANPILFSIHEKDAEKFSSQFLGFLNSFRKCEEAKQKTAQQSIEHKREAMFEQENKIRQYFENLKVENLPIKGSSPTPGSQVIRRSWNDYVKQHSRVRIVLFSGHEGDHAKTFGTTQGEEYYMIDSCWKDVNPDAVLDVQNPEHMKYIPSHSVDEIVADDARFMPDEIIIYLAETLKPDGQIVFKPGGGLGWPALSTDSYLKEIEIGESGRFAWAPLNLWKKTMDIGAARNEFIQNALKNATDFYLKMGFSKVEYDPQYEVFVLTK